jgi:hypothetical protein
MVAPAAMEQVCKALSALHVITATVRSGAKADLAAVAIRKKKAIDAKVE